MTRPATGPTWVQFIGMLVCCGIVAFIAVGMLNVMATEPWLGGSIR